MPCRGRLDTHRGGGDGSAGRDAGRALREADGARGGIKGLGRPVRGEGGCSQRAPHPRGAREGTGGGVPGARAEARGLRRPGAHLAPPRHLVARDGRPLRRAQGGLPGARHPCRADALGGAAEPALHGPLRGPGPCHGVEVKIDFTRLDSELPPSEPTYIRQSRHRGAPGSAATAGEALSCGARSLVL